MKLSLIIISSTGATAGESLERRVGDRLRYDIRAVVLTPCYEIARFKGTLSVRTCARWMVVRMHAYLCLPEHVLQGNMGLKHAPFEITRSRALETNCRKYQGSSDIRKIQR